MEIDTGEGMGTRIDIVVPLKNAEEEAPDPVSKKKKWQAGA